jgi:type I restriction enzyme S subunit
MNVEGWRVAPLGEVCEISTKLALDPEPAPETEVTFVPMAAIDETEGAIAAAETRRYSDVRRGFTSFRENDVLFAKITPCMENGKAAIARNLRNGLGFGSTEFYVLRPGRDVHPEWLFAFIRRPAFRAEAKANFTGSAGQQRVSIEFLRRVEIPVPPLGEQDAIIKLLSEGNKLLGLRNQCKKLTDAIIPSLFENAFGDPASNPKGWDTFPIGDICDPSPNYGTMIPGTETRRRWLLLRVGNIRDGALDLSDRKYVDLPENAIPRHTVQNGDLLLARAIGSEELLGKCVTVYPNGEDWAFDSHLMRVRLDQQKAEPEMLRAFLTSAGGRRLFLNNTRKSAVQFNINTKEFTAINIPLPPLALQKAFAVHVAATHSVQAEQIESGNGLNNLFQTLLARAFNGELTVRWRAEQTPLDLPASIEIGKPAAVLAAEPEAPPISIPENIADRDHLYTSLSQAQRALFNRVAAEPNYFTAEEIAKEDEFNLVGVKRGLQLLAAAGFIVPVSRAVNPSGSQIFYVDSYRMPRTDDDCRLDFEAPMP